jgi:hypothetical protein
MWDFGYLVNEAGSVDDRGTRHLTMLLGGMDDLAGSFRAKKKVCYQGHCIVSTGLLWKPSGGCRQEKLSCLKGSWMVRRRMSMRVLERGWAYLREVYAHQALLEFLEHVDPGKG